MANIKIENLLADILSEVRTFNRVREKWLSLNELSDYLQLKPSTIYQYVNKKRIPFRKIPESSKLIFLRSEIDLWILNQKQSPVKNEEQTSSNIEEAIAGANRIWSEIQESSN